MTGKAPKQKQRSELGKVIREQLDDGVPREKIAEALRVSLKTVDAFRAHYDNVWLTQEQMLKRAYRFARARSLAEGLEPLSWCECKSLWEEQGKVCALTGIRFSNSKINKNGKILRYPLRPSLDRKRTTRGYTFSNVRIVTQWANFARGEWTDATFRLMCRAVIKKLEQESR